MSEWRLYRGTIPILLSAFIIFSPALSGAVPGPDSVAVVANANIQASKNLARVYAAARKVPNNQICDLDLPIPEYDPTPIPPGKYFNSKRDWVTTVEFHEQVLVALERCLGPEATSRLEAVVLMRGVPLQVLGGPGEFSSFAAALSPWKSTTGSGQLVVDTGPTPSGVWPNLFLNAPDVFDADWERVGQGPGTSFTARPLLVTMLHGLSYDDARGLLNNALHAERVGGARGQFLFLKHSDDPARNALDFEYPGVMQGLKDRGFSGVDSFEYHVGTQVTGRTLAALFVGSVDLGPATPTSTIEGNRYAPGALVDNLTSSAAHPFYFDPARLCPVSPPPGTPQYPCWQGLNQPAISRWVAKGVTGAQGCAHEPTAPYASPSRYLILDYVDGATLSEAYFRHMPRTFWQNLVLGDPMAAPYAKRPTVRIQNVSDGGSISGTRQMTVNATDTYTPPRGIHSLRVLVNGVEVARTNGSTLQACVGADVNNAQILAVAQANNTQPQLGPGQYRPKGWTDLHVNRGAGPATAPCPPYIRAVELGDGTAKITWNAPPTGGSPITGYTITASPGGSSISVGPRVTQGTLAGLDNTVNYTFAARATNAAGTSAASSPVGVPGPATNVVAKVQDGTAIVSWSAPPFTGSAPVTKYIVTSNPGGISQTVDPAYGPLSVTLTGLTSGTKYTFTVRASNWYGTGRPTRGGSPT